jgi:hypothetical protein
MKKAISTIALIPLSLGGIAFSSLQAQAANIGPAGIPCTNCFQISNTGAPNASDVRFTITDPNGTPANPNDDVATFWFDPAALNFETTGAAGGPFAGFIGTDGTAVGPLVLPFSLDGTGYPGGVFTLPTPQTFLVLDPGAPDGEDKFILEQVFRPIFTDIPGGSSFFIAELRGHFISGDGTAYNGSLTVQSTFNGQSVATVLTNARQPGGTSSSWSATGSISPRPVPEPSAVLGLVAIFGSGVLLRKKSN